MRVLVTGSSGFIGRHLVRRLLNEGHTVIGVDIQVPPITMHDSSPAWSFHPWDIRNHNALARIFSYEKPSHVVHLAAESSVIEAAKNPTKTIDVNVLGFQNVIDRALAAGVQNFVHASSAAVYGDYGNPVSEGDSLRPVSLYGATKVANEVVAHAYGQTHGMATTGLRFFNVYGPECRPDNVFYRFAEATRKRERIKLYNDGESTRNFVYVDDVTRAIIAALSRPVIGKVYNIASYVATNIDHAVSLFQKAYGDASAVEYLPKREGEIEWSHAYVHEAHRNLDWRPEIDLEVGLERFAAWYKEAHK